MSTGQLAISLLCLVLGYWLVSSLMDRFGKRPERRDDDVRRGDSSTAPRPGPSAGPSGWSRTAGQESQRERGPYAGRNPGADRNAGGNPGSSASGEPPRAPRADETVTLTNWYRVLGVSEKASKETIVAAYKKKISENHPDKVAMMGEEIRQLAESKSKQINAAYEFAMRLYK